ncbi:MAG: MBL fold metallo-hydrolase [Gemmatimonadaceae bacterium]
MRLTTIGTGTAAPSPGRVSSGQLVDCGAALVLMDCGSGVVHRMAELGLAWPAITHVALTHFHNDHIGDLSTLVFAWRHGVLPPRSAPVEIVGPVGTAELVDRLAAAFGAWLREPGFPLAVREIEPGAAVELAPGVTLAAHKTRHTDESLSYALTTARRRLVYTGDTGYDDALADWASGCDVLLAECSLPQAMAMPVHLTPEECGLLAARARPGRLALTHFYPPVERVDIRAGVATAFDGPLTLAVDGWTLDLEE